MSATEFDRVITAKNLPSLPAVAVHVLELARNPDVSLDDIARVIQNDQAIAAKVLRTVNSSYFGLGQPCGTIARAIGYLGLNAVKSLVLGFSLVDMSNSIEDGFDLEAYWQRSIYSAAAARRIADEATNVHPDEAFCAALFADIGMLASFVALGDKYSAVLAQSPDASAGLVRCERQSLGFDHTKAGAELARKWKLPGPIIEAIALHHAGDAAAGANAGLARTVALGVGAADCFCGRPSTARTNALLANFRAWCDRGANEVERLLKRIQGDAAQLGDLFEQDVGGTQSTSEIMAEASDALAEHTFSVQRESEQLQQVNEQLMEQSLTDALTKVGNRKRFEQEIAAIVEAANAASDPLSILFIDADRFKSVNDTHGHQAGDSVLRAIAQRIHSMVPEPGVMCRYGGEEFAVLLPATGLDDAVAVAESCREHVSAKPIPTGIKGVGSLRVTVSVGVACDTGPTIAATDLVERADRAVYVAKANGRNRVEADRPEHGSTGAAARQDAADRLNVLLIEDDALAAKLIQVVLSRTKSVRTIWLTRVRPAVEFLSRYNEAGSPVRIHRILADMGFPDGDGTDIIRAARANPHLAHVPIFAVSTDERRRQTALDAGADEFFSKSALSKDTAGLLGGVLGAHRAAA